MTERLREHLPVPEARNSDRADHALLLKSKLVRRPPRLDQSHLFSVVQEESVVRSF